MFSFEGDYKRRRNIRLGGSHRVDNRSTLIQQAQQQRQQREEERRRQQAAIQIQRCWRVKRQQLSSLAQIRLQWQSTLQDYEQSWQHQTLALSSHPCTNQSTMHFCQQQDYLTEQLLIFYEKRHDLTRLIQYCRILLTPIELNGTHDKDDNGNNNNNNADVAASSVLRLYVPLLLAETHCIWRFRCQLLGRLVASQLATDSSDATKDGVFLQLLKHLLNISGIPALATAHLDLHDGEIINAALAINGVFNDICQYLVNQPLGQKDLPSIRLVSKCIVLIMQSVPSEKIIDVTCNVLLSAEQLAHRLPLDLLSQFSVAFPFSHLLKLLLQDESIITADNSVAILTNIITFGQTRIPQLIMSDKIAYMQVLAKCISAIPLCLQLATTTTTSTTTTSTTTDTSYINDDNPPSTPLSSISRKSSGTLVNEQQKQAATSFSTLHHIRAITNATDMNDRVYEQHLFILLMYALQQWEFARGDLMAVLLTRTQEIPLLQQCWQLLDSSSLLGELHTHRFSVGVFRESQYTGAVAALLILCELYSRSLVTLTDTEFYGDANPLPLPDVVDISAILRNVAFALVGWRYYNDRAIMTDPQQYKTIHQLRISSIRLIQQIHARDSRRKFCPTGHWYLDDIDLNIQHFDISELMDNEHAEYDDEEEDDTEAIENIPHNTSAQSIILRQIPFLIPFADRVQLLQQLVYRSEERNRSLIRTLVPREISIRRSHVFEDAFNHIMSSERGEYSNFQVRFIDQFGMEESGFGGGIFKEFITILSNEAFNNEDLFSLTTDNRLYPRVDRFALQEQNLKKYEFLGIIVGLAIRDGILLDITMAGFFLNKWLGKISSLEDLASLDPDLYRGLVFLKGYDGNVEDLSLNFTIMDKEPDGLRERALVPNGANIPVNSDNRLNYVYLVANYRLNVQIERQSRAFLRGLSHLIELRWLRLFDTLELQGLIGGAYKPIDVEDLRHNTVYGGDYHDKHPIIQRFWRVVDSFDDEQRRKLLRFATSCSRPPLLGFADLRPKFAINPAENDQDRLPTTATCMNLLKLPPFKTYEIMKEKLLYAINTEAGFDLS